MIMSHNKMPLNWMRHSLSTFNSALYTTGKTVLYFHLNLIQPAQVGIPYDLPGILIQSV